MIESVGGRAVFRATMALLVAATAAVLAEPTIAQAQVIFADGDGTVVLPSETDSKQFDAGQLERRGMDGLREILDELLPDTAAPAVLQTPASQVNELIAQLGHDQFRVRQSAMERLRDLGEGARPLLMRAAKSDNAEVSWRAVRILRAWDARKYADKPQHLEAYSSYCRLLRDEQRLKELLRRTKQALEHGLWGETRQQILVHSTAALLRADKEEYAAPLRPFFDHGDLQIALLILEAAGDAVQSAEAASFDRSQAMSLIVQAIGSPREEVASVAINHAGYLIERSRGSDSPLRKALQAAFDGTNEPVRFQAACVLMQRCKSEAARDFVLGQLKGGDLSRKYAALNMLQSQPPRKAEPDRKLLDALQPLLSDADMNTKMMAVNVLSSYAGPEVVRRLLPLLGEKKERHIAMHVAQQLRQQPDKKMLRSEIKAVLEDQSRKSLHSELQSFLKQLGDEPEGAAEAETSEVPEAGAVR